MLGRRGINHGIDDRPVLAPVGTFLPEVVGIGRELRFGGGRQFPAAGSDDDVAVDGGPVGLDLALGEGGEDLLVWVAVLGIEVAREYGDLRTHCPEEPVARGGRRAVVAGL